MASPPQPVSIGDRQKRFEVVSYALGQHIAIENPAFFAHYSRYRRTYPSSHNHGTEKSVPATVLSFQIQPFSSDLC